MYGAVFRVARQRTADCAPIGQCIVIVPTHGNAVEATQLRIWVRLPPASEAAWKNGSSIHSDQ